MRRALVPFTAEALPPEMAALLAGPVGQAVADAAAYASKAQAENTKRAYETDWRLFSASCEAAGVRFGRGIEDTILQTCCELGIGFVPYSPLGRGFLSGAIKSRADLEEGDYRLRDPRFSAENFEKNLELVEVIRRVGEPRGASSAQVALVWLLAQGDDIVPIPGVKRRQTMDDSMRAANLVLSDDEIATLSTAASPNAIAGQRYSAVVLKTVEL